MWIVEQAGQTVAAFVKARANVAWSIAKRHVATGKVFVDGARITEIDHRLAAGQQVELVMAAPRPHDPAREAVLVYDDAHVVVLDKPAGVSSVPFEDRETGTAMDLVRGAWRRLGKDATSVPLHIVHRIDRATSGLLMFAKTKRAELGLAAQLRAHAMERTYLCVAHGVVAPGRIESRLVADRGDGLRGSTTDPDRGKRAVTHVEVRRALRRAAHAMFGLDLVQHSERVRASLGELVGEVVATFGLWLVIATSNRARPAATPAAVALYIVAAYWFTSSTSFANPAVTVARCFTNTFVGIRAADVAPFIAAQLLGGAVAAAFTAWLLREPPP